ncbi:MAG: guanylate kinase [Elusimicrobia bacterium]|nr:guanylate kinase [Elusimicrobiota bacterium]
MPRNKKGLLFVLSAPSGAGKSTLARAIVYKDARFIHPVSYTTRPSRPGEKNGRDYHFVSREKFEEFWRQGRFWERTEAHGAFYGTPKEELERALSRGRYVLLAIDIKGARALAEAYPHDTVRIFLLPPTRNAWIARLKKRRESDMDRRIANADMELRELPRYDYVLINDELGRATNDFFAIVRAEELKRLKTNPKGWVAASLSALTYG